MKHVNQLPLSDKNFILPPPDQNKKDENRIALLNGGWYRMRGLSRREHLAFSCFEIKERDTRLFLACWIDFVSPYFTKGVVLKY